MGMQNERERGICAHCGGTIERLPWIPHDWAHRDFNALPGSGYLGGECSPLPRTKATPKNGDGKALTPERIAELRALAEKAVPGPWRVGEGPTWDDVMAGDGDLSGFVAYSARYNAPFIAAARTALPEALDYIDVLNSQVDCLLKANDNLRGAIIRARDALGEAL